MPTSVPTLLVLLLLLIIIAAAVVVMIIGIPAIGIMMIRGVCANVGADILIQAAVSTEP